MAAECSVIVVGGGLAGAACAKRLAHDDRVRVTLLDKNGRHEFQPLLYQVATAELGHRDMTFDLADLFGKLDNVTVRTGEVVAADPQRHEVTLADGSTLAGDVLVLAAGAQPNFFNTPGAEQYAYPLYSLDHAVRIRDRVLELFRDTAQRPELVGEGALTFVVVGGGPTGVETAGALAELAHDVMPHVHPEVAVAAQVILVDLGHSVLGAFSADAHDYAARQLHKRGVTLRLGQSVAEVTADHVMLHDGTRINTRMVVWGGGEMAAPLAAHAGLGQGHGGRVDVRTDLTVDGTSGVYALGDMANIPYGEEPSLPQLGSVAQQSGEWAARNILADLDGAPREPFAYRDKGIMAMIGRKAAVAEVGAHRHELHGRIAFAAWLGVHAELLSNLGAELNAFVSWAEEFYLRPHKRSAKLLEAVDPDAQKIKW